MRRYLLLLAAAVILAMATADAIWPKQPPLLIQDTTAAAYPGVWPRGASAAPADPPFNQVICIPVFTPKAMRPADRPPSEVKA